MASKEIGKAFVTLAVKGFGKLKIQLQKAREEGSKTWKEFSRQAEDAGKKAAVAFASMSAGIAGFVSAASPRDMDNLKGAFLELSVQVGRILIPIIRDLTTWVERLRDYFRGLSDEQRAQILGYVKIALTVAAVTVAFGKMLAAMNAIKAHPVWLVVAALAAAYAAAQNLNAELERLKESTARAASGDVRSGDFHPQGLKNLTDSTKGQSKEEQMKYLEKQEAQLNKAYGDYMQRNLVQKTADVLKSRLPTWMGGSDDDKSNGEKILQELANIKGLRSQLQKGKTPDQVLKENDAKEKGDPRFMGSMRPQAPQLSAIADAWKKAQTSQQYETPEMRLYKEQIKISTEIRDKLPDRPVERQDMGAQ